MSGHTDISSPESFWAEAEYLGRALKAQLEYFQALGLESLPLSAAPPEPQAPPKGPSVSSPPERAARAGRPQRGVSGTWEELCQAAAGCSACSLAALGRPEPFFGLGGLKPLMVFVGQGAECWEGETAALMQAIASRGFGLSDEQYRLTSLVKCGRLEASEASDREMETCFKFLRRELELLSPKVILAFGSAAAKVLTGLDRPLGYLKARTYKIPWLEGCHLRLSYDLRELAAQPELKKDAWRDYQKMLGYINQLRQRGNG